MEKVTDFFSSPASDDKLHILIYSSLFRVAGQSLMPSRRLPCLRPSSVRQEGKVAAAAGVGSRDARNTLSQRKRPGRETKWPADESFDSA